MESASLPVYVVDTYALFWFRRDARRLSPAADAVFRLASVEAAVIIVPAIVVAELYQLTRKQGNPISPAVLLADISRSREFVFSKLGQAQLEMMAAVQGIVDMHDRLIVAEALVRQAPIITKDEVLRRSGLAPVIW